MTGRVLPAHGSHPARSAPETRARGTYGRAQGLRRSPALFQTRGDPGRPWEPWAICAFAHESGGVSPHAVEELQSRRSSRCDD
jgi:hypothetical protein